MRYPQLLISELSGWFGYTRQNYYKRIAHYNQRVVFEQQVLDFVKAIRERQPRIGTKKLHYLVGEVLGKDCIGRDALYNLLRLHGLLIRRRKRYRPKMTDGNGKSIYPDLRKDFTPTKINELWCSDITYIDLDTEERHCYLVCITDEYSHLIVGYSIALNMKTEQLIKALNQAVKSELDPDKEAFIEPVILHSDRGAQYKSREFQRLLKRYNILPSMCAAGKSHENPVAERLNGVLKHELLVENSFESFQAARQSISKAVEIYNEERPHLSCELLTPRQAHYGKDAVLKKLWRQRKTKRRRFSEA